MKEFILRERITPVSFQKSPVNFSYCIKEASDWKSNGLLIRHFSGMGILYLPINFGGTINFILLLFSFCIKYIKKGNKVSFMFVFKPKQKEGNV